MEQNPANLIEEEKLDCLHYPRDIFSQINRYLDSIGIEKVEPG